MVRKVYLGKDFELPAKRDAPPIAEHPSDKRSDIAAIKAKIRRRAQTED